MGIFGEINEDFGKKLASFELCKKNFQILDRSSEKWSFEVTEDSQQPRRLDLTSDL